MHNILSQSLGQLAIVLHVLSVALAAPAVYEIQPQFAPQGGLDVSDATPPLIVPLIGANSQKSLSQGQIRTFIAQKAREYGISGILALELAHIESRFDPKAKNPSSTATGIYQWLKGSWESFCEGNQLDVEDNVLCTMKTLQNPAGIRHWTVVTSTRIRFLELGLIRCSSFSKNLCEIIK